MTTHATDTNLKRTALAHVHETLGAKMVPFAGFWMPVQYASITQEHRAVRERVGVFDISHMGEFVLEGPRALEGSRHLAGQVRPSGDAARSGGDAAAAGGRVGRDRQLS